MKQKNNLLEVENMNLNYGSIEAIKDISLSIKKEEIVSLVGANGAGKSSLIKGIINIEKTEGDIFFRGKDISDLSTEKIVSRGISIIPEGHLIFSTLTVFENLQLGVYQGKDRADINLDQIYDYFPILQKRKEQKAGTLSGGEQQMLSIGRALLSGPELLLIDEPSLGLAPRVVNDIFNILKRLNSDGYTILLSEQNAKKALDIAERGYLLRTGSVIKEGRADDLLKESNFAKIYLGGDI